MNTLINKPLHDAMLTNLDPAKRQSVIEARKAHTLRFFPEATFDEGGNVVASGPHLEIVGNPMTLAQAIDLAIKALQFEQGVDGDLGRSADILKSEQAVAVLRAALSQAEQRVADLEKVAKPFADLAKRYPSGPTHLVRDDVELWQVAKNKELSLRELGLTVGHLRDAARALSQTEQQGGGAVGNERAAFEAKFPRPSNCEWWEGGFRPTTKASWRVQTHQDRWDGWQARAAISQPEQKGGGAVAVTAYARHLTITLHAKHYAHVTEWKPLDDLAGLLTQIDNMTAGLTLTPVSDPKDLEAELRRARENERLRFEGDLDKWMKTIGAGITGYQPEAYTVMDAACEELVTLRGRVAELEAHVRSLRDGLTLAGNRMDRIALEFPMAATWFAQICGWTDDARTLLARLDKKGDDNA